MHDKLQDWKYNTLKDPVKPKVKTFYTSLGERGDEDEDPKGYDPMFQT